MKSLQQDSFGLIADKTAKHGVPSYTLKISMLVEEGNSNLKYLRRVSHPEIKFCEAIQSGQIYFSGQDQIAYVLTQEAVHLLLHFKGGVYICGQICLMISVASNYMN